MLLLPSAERDHMKSKKEPTPPKLNPGERREIWLFTAEELGGGGRVPTSARGLHVFDFRPGDGSGIQTDRRGTGAPDDAPPEAFRTGAGVRAEEWREVVVSESDGRPLRWWQSWNYPRGTPTAEELAEALRGLLRRVCHRGTGANPYAYPEVLSAAAVLDRADGGAGLWSEWDVQK